MRLKIEHPMKKKKLFSHAATILPVDDIMEAAAYYRDFLGFTIAFTWGNPVDYAVVSRDDAVAIHFSKRVGVGKLSADQVVLYIFVYDVDAVYQEYEQNGVPISMPIGDRLYGMRDFDIKDPNGYILSFGKSLELT